jgi:type IV pilus assembly protein PilA
MIYLNCKIGGGKKMKSKKGFTLIELLAVIVILAVIALIATPLIMNVINDAKKNSAKDSAYGYTKAVENAMVTYMYTVSDPNNMPSFENGTFDVATKKYTPAAATQGAGTNDAEVTLDVTYSGTQAVSGTLTIKKGVITATTNLSIGGYTITIADGKITNAVANS